jgi:ABC-type dipeptide/oligopeptide/nickel transport system permease subunit
MAAIAVVATPNVARIVRSVTLTERNNAYVDAARACGAGDARILFRHIVPNIAPVAIIVATTLLGSAVLAEAALSFLGLGIPSTHASWGSDVSQARLTFPINTWSAFFPGAAICLSVLAFNLLGDALRDALDPRLR